MRKFLLLFAALALSIGLWAQTQMVTYRYPVYKTAGDPTSGIASWGINLVNATVVDHNTRFLSTGWYVVTGSDVQTAALICNGAANLILADGATLTATGGYPNAGITVYGEGNSLTIYAQSTDPAQMGTLFAIGSPQAAGIGGGQGSDGSNITINGGYVTANAGSTAAGIGGGNGGIGSNITINGGIVTANSGAGAAGIGGGFGSNGSDITINGGTVTANAAPGGAGIGGGNGGNGLGITINDGSVTANSPSAAGIGGGNEGDGSNITINGGTVTANGGSIASGIGGGYAGNGSDITINGGTVTANAGPGASGIGGGDQSVNITVATTLLVKADGNNPPTTVITNDGSDLAGTLANKQYVTIETLTIAVISANVNDTTMGSVTGAGEYAVGSEVTLTATPVAHYRFVNWDNGSTDNPLTFTVVGDSTVTAIFAIDQHLLTVAMNDESMGSVSGGGIYNYGSDVSITATPLNGHVSFGGWSNGATTPTTTINVTCDSTVTALFLWDEHTVTTLVNDESMGSVSGAGTYTHNDVARLIATPTDHHVFIGWSNALSDDTIDVTVVSDTLLTATFDWASYNVTTLVNDESMGSVDGANSYDYGSSATLTAVPAAHHHFVRWNNGSTDNPTHLLVTGDTAVTATFAIDRHVVTTIVNNIDLGEVSGAGTHDYGETVTLTATPYAHAVFSGWSNGETANPLNITLEKDTTITAIFTVDSHVISATVNDETMGSVTGAQTYTHGAMATLTATANEHYHFVNWSNGITANTFSILVEKDSAVIANFEIDRHVVTGVANNAALGRVDGADTLNYGATATLTAIPAAHAVFTGWSNGETANPLNITVESDTTVTAIFTVDSHVISATVNVDSMGTVTGAGTYDHGKTAILTATANAHHHFVNWSNEVTANTFGILVEKDSAVTANFAIDEHVLTLGVNIADAGTVTGAGTFAWNSQTVISATANEHYVFSRWSNGETANPLTINVENDTTVTAIFTVDSHVISATVNDGTMGSVSGAGTYDHGKTAILTATANDHYHFVNWDNGVTANTFGILVEKDSAVTANFEIDRHVVTTIVNDAALGSVSGAGTYNYGAIATLTATPADHAIFTGWSNGETTPTININVEGDTIVTAMFIYDSHVISANVNDETMGTVVGTGTFMHGATAILTAIPNAPYHFVNWSNGETTETIVINVTMDSTLIAYFSIDQHNVTVTVNDPDGGVATGSGTYSYGDTVMLKATANEHYSFTGWSNGETDTVIYVIVNGNIDITANFTIDQHAVNATIEGVGTVKHCGYYDYGSEAVLEAIPGDGWIFQGWDNGETSETLTITVTCDTTVHAIFVRRSSVDDTEADSYVAYAGYNEIVVTGAADHTVAVYDMNGRLVKAIDNASDIERINVNVAGVYLIRVSNMTATRVVVK